MIFLLVILCVIFVTLSLLFVWVSLAIFFHGVPFVPTTDRVTEAMIGFAGDLKGKKVADLGCGDGRIPIAAARAGARADGYEIMLPVWALAKIKQWLSGSSARIYKKNLFRVDLSSYDVIFCYLTQGMMKRVYARKWFELKPETVVITNSFRIPQLEPIEEKQIGKFKLRKYVKK